jgi:hypothetical protein
MCCLSLALQRAASKHGSIHASMRWAYRPFKKMKVQPMQCSIPCWHRKHGSTPTMTSRPVEDAATPSVTTPDRPYCIRNAPFRTSIRSSHFTTLPWRPGAISTPRFLPFLSSTIRLIHSIPKTFHNTINSFLESSHRQQPQPYTASAGKKTSCQQQPRQLLLA